MKSYLLSTLLLCSCSVFSQHIKFSETDSATNTRRIATTSRWVNKNLGNGFAVAFRSEDTAVFVQLSIFPSATGLVAQDNALVFQLEDNSIIVARSKGMQVNIEGFNKPFEYRISLQDVKALDQQAIKSISYYTAGGQYKSIQVDQADKNDLQQVCTIFLNEYQNEPTISNHTAKLMLTK